MARSKRPLLYHRRFKELPCWTPDRIRMLRLHLGMTQEQLAQELALRGKATICDWENGWYKPVRSSQLLLTILADKARFQIGGLEYES